MLGFRFKGGAAGITAGIVHPGMVDGQPIFQRRVSTGITGPTLNNFEKDQFPKKHTMDAVGPTTNDRSTTTAATVVRGACSTSCSKM